MHHNDWLQRNKVIKPGTANSQMRPAGTKTQNTPYYQQISSQFKSTSKVGIIQKKQLHQLRETNAENQLLNRDIIEVQPSVQEKIN
jgi:hypothetical protein